MILKRQNDEIKASNIALETKVRSLADEVHKASQSAGRGEQARTKLQQEFEMLADQHKDMIRIKDEHKYEKMALRPKVKALEAQLNDRNRDFQMRIAAAVDVAEKKLANVSEENIRLSAALRESGASAEAAGAEARKRVATLEQLNANLNRELSTVRANFAADAAEFRLKMASLERTAQNAQRSSDASTRTIKVILKMALKHFPNWSLTLVPTIF